ncbi:hypothetical protein LTR36_005931 [Oleoguttula mirabilis]|uniref:Uncharacterized protein n=1 Tax=Oleoguttula mirabilis TaxID=1507867 RepID=A0AAV9JDB4_9PEZI|nr:hypothetical protein LTR36_005931 [Oleoguttula mirabilis]
MVEHVQHKRAEVYLANALTILWYICWPVGMLLYYLAVAVLFVLKLLYRPAGFLLQPFVYLGRFIVACLIAPFQLLVRFETLYIYLGVAAIAGLTVGLAVSYAYGSLSSLLRLGSEPESAPGRTAKEYRVAKRTEKAKLEAPLMTAGAHSPAAVSPSHMSMSDSARKARRSKGLLNQTIMEVDSDY